jgi:hypothetical protein
MASISWKSASGTDEVLEFDVLVSYAPSHSAKATQFPVEKGATITDHVLQDADLVRFEGLVTNTPLPSNVGMGFEAVATDMRERFAGRAGLVYAALVRVKEAGEPVTIDTPLRFFENMVIESLETSESAETGDALSFSISAREIRTTETRTVQTPKVEAAQPKKNKGRQPTKKAEGPPKTMFKAGKEAGEKLLFNTP